MKTDNNHPQKNKNLFSYICTILFCFFILYNLLFFLMNMPGEFDRSTVKNYFNNIQNRQYYINLYGGVQSFMGKRQIEEYTFFKNDYNKLVRPVERYTDDYIEKEVAAISPLWEYLDENGIPYVYIAPPLPIVDVNDLPYKEIDYSHENYIFLHSLLPEMNMIELDEELTIPKEKLFYRTDHHWSGDSCFDAYNLLQDYLYENGCINDKISRDEFERVTADGFLGSYGVKVGSLYAGYDEYVYYRPTFDTDIECEVLTADGVLESLHEGSWEKALIDCSILEDKTYYNKYNAALWGNSGENRIINNAADEGKILLISHSYGRPLAAYLALNYHEVRQLDPQKGRFNGNFPDYISDYDPDMVFFFTEFEGEIIGEYNTGD